MAERTELDSHPTQIAKDIQGSDNAIPLSPQWLQSKPGDAKTGPFTGENSFSPLPSNASRLASVKPTGAVEELIDNSKKKDVFRPSVLDMESGRRDRWRDEERDTNSSARKDRWREGEREHVDNNRRVDRPQRVDSSGRNYGDTRRAPGERWTDSGNKDNRESKWNSRWGHDEKEADAVRDKWEGSNKEDDVLLDKGPSQVPSRGKEEKDGDHYRPWRPNSSYSRGRSEPHQTLTPDKQVPTFSHGRGRGENPVPVYSHGRGRARSGGNLVTHVANHLQPHGPLIEKSESGYGELSPLSYSRTKLIDIYRTTDMMNFSKYAEGFVQVPSLTQEGPIEPLLFCAPTPEELDILKGIDTGEVIGSGAPQVSKEGSAGRTTTDFMQSRRSRIGTAPDDSKHDTLDNPDGYLEGSIQEKHGNRWTNAKIELNAEALKEDTTFRRKGDDISAARESITPGTWRSSSVAERSRLTSDRRELAMDIPKDLNNVWQNTMTDSPNTKKGAPKWQVGVDPVMRREPPSAMNRDIEPPITSHPSPEDLVLYYKDPQGEIQGPFAGSDIITWFESGYFGIELHVRLAGAPSDSPFSLLGDIMPHLRAKARPPPGFKTPKADETKDTPGIPSFTSSGKLHAVASESDVLKNDPRYQHGFGSATEAENRYLESLMAGGLSNVPFDKFAFSEGMQGYGGTNFIPRPPLGSSSGDDPYLLAQKLALERQRSIPNPYSLWPGRDAPSVTTNTDVINESSLARAQHHPQTVVSSPVNGISGWMNFPTQGGLDPLHDKLDGRQTQNVPPQSALGIMLQRLQPQNPSLSSLLAQSLDNSSRIPTPEHIQNSGIPQDQQILSLLQQQYLLQQVQSQPPVAAQQLTLLDMMLKQQQKQEEQQQLMRQQQQLLSQVLSEHQHNQSLGEVPFAQLQAGFSAGNANVDHSRLQQHHDIFQMGPQVQASTGMRDDKSANPSDLVLPPRDSQDVGRNMGSENPEVLMYLPHQMYANTPKQKTWDGSLPGQIVGPTNRISGTTDGIETKSKYDEAVRVSTTSIASSFSAREHLGESDPHQQVSANFNNEAQFHGTIEALAETPAGALVEPRDTKDQHIVDSSVVKEVKNPDDREVKKVSEKKSRKQKSSKASIEPISASKLQQLKSESEGKISGNAKSETHATSVKENEKINIKKVIGDASSPLGQSSLPAVNYTDDAGNIDTYAKPGQVSQTQQVSIQANAGQRAWKPAPGFKPKSFIEIQQEEQRRAQEEQRRAQEEAAVSNISTSLSSVNVSTPWAGIVVNADHKALEEIRQEAASTETNFSNPVRSSNLNNKNIQNEDLFWGGSVDKIGDREVETSNSAAPLTSIMSSQTDIVDDDFIDAKESKKSRKKSAKAKNAVAKATPVAAADVYVGPSTNDKGKNTRQVQQQKEVLPALPSGPSLGDFVPWKGEPASPPAPAWSDSGKPNKPASLRDILKEQGKRVSSPLPVPAPQKPAIIQPARGSGPSWSYSSSPAKAASPMTINSQTSSQPKHKVEDDLFWGPVDPPKSEDKQLEFPQLSSQGSWGSKSTPSKGNTGGTISQQKSTGSKPADYSLPKGKKNAMSKNSEAVDFKEWCESECIRLIGSKDTSILEYCLKISRSEAETLLIENLGSFDRNHEFIDKFLSYKDFLPADVVEIAFKNHSDWKTTASGAGDMISDHVHFGGCNPGSAGGAIDGPTKAGKKKGKKGKKVSASVLGFNVVSSRIMMGEIQTADE